tara:strand:+ start:36359 stop:38218 length:1860 start_codon:yes stop_codon:yes gene_type:complete
MCGFACAINIDNISPDKIHKSMIHRGPDSKGSFSDENLQIFHNRLSIQDLSKDASQPMIYKNYIIAYNGEIYNHLELRGMISEYLFKTNSDTETLLYLFIKFGKNCLNHIDGMFSFIIYNTDSKKVFFARDRAGKKPFYYYKNNKMVFLASELKTMTESIRTSINPVNINFFLRAGFFYKSQTPYENIHELPSGSYGWLDVTNLKIEINKWWDISKLYRLEKLTITENDALEKIDYALKKSIKRRLSSSDLEVGSFLSGGIDSGIISAIASRYNNNLKTFTVSFDGQYDESKLSDLVANKYELNHRTLKIDYNNLSHEIEKILCNYGEPFSDSSAIPSYYICKEAKKYLTVIINGDGGDELFGGYRRYVPYKYYNFLKSDSYIKFILSLYAKLAPTSQNKMSINSFLHRLASLSSKKSVVETYLSSTTDIFEGHLNYFEDENLGFDQISNDINQSIVKIENSLDLMLATDFDTLLFGDLLVKMDIATMSNSIEGRSPFLGKEILEIAPLLPNKYKVNNFTTKYILRKLAKKYLPNEIIKQPKRGFEVPLAYWIDNQLKTIVSDYLISPKISTEYIDSSFIQKLLSKNLNVSPIKRAKMIWNIFTLEVWYKNYQKSSAKS